MSSDRQHRARCRLVPDGGPAAHGHSPAALMDPSLPIAEVFQWMEDGHGAPVGGDVPLYATEVANLPEWAAQIRAVTRIRDREMMMYADSMRRILRQRPAGRPGEQRVAPRIKLVVDDGHPLPDIDDDGQVHRAIDRARGHTDALTWWAAQLPTLLAVYERGDQAGWSETVTRHCLWARLAARLEAQTGSSPQRAVGRREADAEIQTLLQRVIVPSRTEP